MTAADRAHRLQTESHLRLAPVRDRARCVLVFPNKYNIGMSALAVHALYSALNERGLACERAFAPDGPWPTDLRSLESQTPLAGFDYVLITSSFELDWLNVPAMLAAGGIPPLREDREDHHPILLAGGPAVTCNPLPLLPIVDGCVLGEVEPIADRLAALFIEADSRQFVFEGLAALPGVVLSGVAPEPVDRLVAANLQDFSTETAILTPDTEFGNRFLIEISRGCGRSCAFCLARQIYHPFRARRPDLLVPRIRRAMEHTPQVGLVAAAVSDYPWAEELFPALEEMQARVSVSSVRAESVSDSLLRLLAASGQGTLTLAPEAATEEARGRVGKAMLDEHLFRAVELALAHGITRFRLYFMVGLPGETAEEAALIPELVGRLRAAAPGAGFSLSVSPFVPRPYTPLADVAVLPQAEVRRRMAHLGDDLRRQGVTDVTLGSARWAEAQAVLGRGGPELGEALVRASLAGRSYADLRSAVKRTGRKWTSYLAAGGI